MMKIKIIVIIFTILIATALISCNRRQKDKLTYNMSGISFEDKYYTYDGLAHKLEIVGNLPKGVSVNYENNVLTNVGFVESIAKFTGDYTKYNDIPDMKAILKIIPREININVNSDLIIDYDGFEHKNINLSFSNVINNENIDFKIDYNTDFKNVGLHTANVEIFNPNYILKNSTISMEIVNNIHKITLKQKGFQDITINVNKYTDYSNKLPLPQPVNGYNISWDLENIDLSCIEQDYIINASYELINYSIRYELNGGINNNLNNVTSYNIESNTIILYEPFKNNILFGGWYTDSSFSTESLITEIEKGYYGDIVLYAKWNNYKIESAEGFIFDYINYELPAITLNVSNIITLLTLSKLITVSENCSWSLSNDIEGIDVIKTKNMSLNEGHNIKYITVWYDDTDLNEVYIVDVYRNEIFTISFDLKGGNDIATMEVEKNTEFILPTPIRENYDFSHWIYNGEVFESKKYTFDTNILLTANWLVDVNIIGMNNELLKNYKILENSNLIKVESIYNGINYNLYNSQKYDSLIDKDTIVTADISIYALEKKEFSYIIENNSIIVTGIYDTDILNIVIPNSIQNIPIIEIQQLSFHDCSSLTSIIIPNSVTSIGQHAFSGCSNLTSIIIPDSVTSIGQHAFSDCNNLTIYCEAKSHPSSGWYSYWNSSNRPVYWGITETNYLEQDGIIYVIKNDKAVVTRYTGIKKNVIIPSVVELNLKEYTVASIGEYSFRRSSNLISIEIPNSVTSIGVDAFVNCSWLVNVYYNGTIEDWCNITFSNVYSNPMYPAKHFYMLDENGEYYEVINIVIPDTITSIDNYQFSHFDNLESIEIPNSVTSIGDYAFYGCNSLTSIIILDSVTSIGQHAFSGCSNLTSIIIPDSVTSIEESAFSWCSSLTSIEIPNSVTSIGVDAFSGCRSLTSIIIPDSVTSIEESAFYRCLSLTSIEIPNSVTSIGVAAFYGCNSLTSIIIPDSVTSIEECAFTDCGSLTSIIIPDSVTSIGAYAFSYCRCLTSIIIPDSVTSIGVDAFSYCNNLTIYCEAKSKPSGWSFDWNCSRPVYWGLKI